MSSYKPREKKAKKRVACIHQGCDMTFSSKFGMERHQVTHRATKDYSCHYCHREFALPQYLKDHLNLHTGEKPYVCEVPGCNASFKQSSSLSNHKRNIHRNESEVETPAQRKRDIKLASKDYDHARITSKEQVNKRSFCNFIPIVEVLPDRNELGRRDNAGDGLILVSESKAFLTTLRRFGPVFRHRALVTPDINCLPHEEEAIRVKVDRLHIPHMLVSGKLPLPHPAPSGTLDLEDHRQKCTKLLGLLKLTGIKYWCADNYNQYNSRGFQ
jgi:hypothetical protein